MLALTIKLGLTCFTAKEYFIKRGLDAYKHIKKAIYQMLSKCI